MKCDIHLEESHLTALKNRDATLQVGTSASCSLWWNQVPELNGERVGVIGEYLAAIAESSRVLLAAACDTLQAQGCTLAIGPMDGNTWRKYRLVIEPGIEPPFFMEPENPAAWPENFFSAGFEVLARYSSTLCTDLTAGDPRLMKTGARLEKNGVIIRNLLTADFAGELSRIYSVAKVSFCENYLYTPLPEQQFCALYSAIRDRLVAELIFIAEAGGAPVGFLFAIPDYQELAQSGSISRVVGKTVAVLPGRKFAGLGSLLVEQLHQRAQQLGFTKVIHALQHESNAKSRNISRQHGKVFRSYALFGRPLR